MKIRLLLFSFLLFISCAFNVNAQLCTPAPGLGNAGIYPDSATGFAAAQQGTYYEQIISVKVPNDTNYLGTNIIISSIKLNSITGLPNGLSYGCVPASCDFPGNQTNCAKIFGTTNDPTGTYPLTVTVTVYSAGVPLQQVTFNYYHIVVNPPASVNNINSDKFSVMPAVPSPCDESTTISYNLISRSSVDFKVVNAIGKEVYHNQLSAPAGSGKFDINTSNWREGVYFYTLNCNGSVVTRKFMVIH